MEHPAYKRKNYLIKRRFQLKYTLAITGLLLLVMCAGGIGLYMGIWGSIIENFSEFKVSENLENAERIADYEGVRYKKGDYRLEKIFREAELLSEHQRDALKNALKAVNRSLLPKILLIVAAIFAGGILVSHKIAGPMYRIERSAEAIRSGDLRVSFNIRKNDEMKETTSVLGDMVRSLHDDIARIKASTIILEDKIGGLIATGCLPKEDAERLKTVIKEMDSLLAKYKT